MIRNFLPYFIYKRFFGDRRKYQTKIKINDKDWKLWLAHIEKIYSEPRYFLYKNFEHKRSIKLIQQIIND